MFKKELFPESRSKKSLLNAIRLKASDIKSDEYNGILSSLKRFAMVCTKIATEPQINTAFIEKRVKGKVIRTKLIKLDMVPEKYEISDSFNFSISNLINRVRSKFAGNKKNEPKISK